MPVRSHTVSYPHNGHQHTDGMLADAESIHSFWQEVRTLHSGACTH